MGQDQFRLSGIRSLRTPIELPAENGICAMLRLGVPVQYTHTDNPTMAKNQVFETATTIYTAEESIGNGGVGTVFRVLDGDGVPYALKLMGDVKSMQRKRFKNELHFCRNQRHDRIIKVIDEGVKFVGEKSYPFYVMPLYESSLRQLMITKRPLPHALSIFRDILDGVEAAHFQGVIHRDLKPENILIDGNGRAAVADFGAAHFKQDDLFTTVETKAKDRLANFRYAAPEQRTTESTVDQRADIFALGLILNEIFTGDAPQGTGYLTIGRVAPAFSYLDPIVERMIQQSPDRRHPAISSVKEEMSVRGLETVALQRLDAVRKEVVPSATPEDPLGGVDVNVEISDYQDGALIFILTPDPPPNWFMALHQLRNAPSFRGMVQPTGVQSISPLQLGSRTGRYVSILANKDGSERESVKPLILGRILQNNEFGPAGRHVLGL